MNTAPAGERMAFHEGDMAVDWERLWAPYDETTYRSVLAAIGPDDVVLDIGAGDLRLARRMAGLARRVYAVEMNPDLLPVEGIGIDNLHVVNADAYQWPFPKGVTVAVLLMRHCRRLALLVDKLAAVGCRWLLTNARWGFGLERLDLRAARVPYRSLTLGWYACRCGATGFVPGPPEALTPRVEAAVQEVRDCPECR